MRRLYELKQKTQQARKANVTATIAEHNQQGLLRTVRRLTVARGDPKSSRGAGAPGADTLAGPCWRALRWLMQRLRRCALSGPKTLAGCRRRTRGCRYGTGGAAALDVWGSFVSLCGTPLLFWYYTDMVQVMRACKVAYTASG